MMESLDEQEHLPYHLQYQKELKEDVISYIERLSGARYQEPHYKFEYGWPLFWIGEIATIPAFAKEIVRLGKRPHVLEYLNEEIQELTLKFGNDVAPQYDDFDDDFWCEREFRTLYEENRWLKILRSEIEKLHRKWMIEFKKELIVAPENKHVPEYTAAAPILERVDSFSLNDTHDFTSPADALLKYSCRPEAARAYFMQLTKYYDEMDVLNFINANFLGFDAPVKPVIKFSNLQDLKPGWVRRLFYDFWFYAGQDYNQEIFVQLVLNNFVAFEAEPDNFRKSFSRAAPKNYPFSCKNLR